MNTHNPHMRRLCRLKWSILGLAALLLLGIEAFYYFVRDVPLIENVLDWVLGMAGATALIEISFWIVEKLQRRLQQEIAERQRVEDALRETHNELERRVQERTAELTEINKALQTEIVERTRAESALERRAMQLALINEIGRKVAAKLDLEEVLRTATTLIQQSFNYHHVALFIVDREQNEAVLRAVAGPYAGRIPGDYRLKLTEGMVGWTATHGTLRLTNNVATDPHYVKGPFSDMMTKAELCAPIKVGGETAGVLDIQSSEPDVFDESDRIVMETLTDQIAVAIENAQLFKQLHVGREGLRHLAQQVVSAQEEERRRLSRELHDEAGQAMTALKISLELIQADLPAKASPLHRRIREAIALTDDTMEQIRLLAQDLRPPALDAVGLSPTLEEFCKEFARRTQIPVDYSGSSLLVLPDAVNICLYRFLQEALTNVAKHANAGHVHVELHYNGTMVALSVADDGQGFDRQAVLSISNQNTGIGLLGMQERIDLLGGWLKIESQPGQGTCLTAHVPWQQEEDE